MTIKKGPDGRCCADGELRTFAAYIERVVAILAANAGMALVLDDEHGAVLDDAGNLHGFLLNEPRDSGSYDFDPRAWAEDRWDCSTFAETWGALDRPVLIPLDPGPRRLMKPSTESGQTTAVTGFVAISALPAALPTLHITLSVSSSHLPDDDAADAFKQANLDWTETGELWVVPPKPLRQQDGMPQWARDILTMADQYGARYVHFEPDGPVVTGIPVHA